MKLTREKSREQKDKLEDALDFLHSKYKYQYKTTCNSLVTKTNALFPPIYFSSSHQNLKSSIHPPFPPLYLLPRKRALCSLHVIWHFSHATFLGITDFLVIFWEKLC